MALPVSKILASGSLLISVAAIGLSFTAKSHLDAARNDANTAQAGLAPALAEVSKSKTEVKTLKDQLTAAASAKDAADAEVTAAKAAAYKVAADLTAANDKLAAATAELATKSQTAGPAAAPTPDPEQEKKLKEVQSQLEEKKQIETTLTAKVNDLTAQVKTFEDAAQMREKAINKPGLAGKVLAVNPGWNFVVLNIGDKEGVALNSSLLIKRGDTMVAKVHVTTVAPTTSIADIVPGVGGKQFHVQPGDVVIYSGI
jgi:septal ring factor EnvC (AmiA/AmiB activator)